MISKTQTLPMLPVNPELTTYLPLCPNGNESNVNSTSPSGLYLFSLFFQNIHSVVGTVICLFGIITNVLNILVLTRPNLVVSPTNLILLVIAIADFFLMSTYLPLLVFIHWDRQQNHHQHNHTMAGAFTSLAWARYQIFVVSFDLICHTTAMWLTVLLAVFRYIHIRLLHNGPQLANLSRAKLCCGLVVLFCVISTVPNILVNQILRCYTDTSAESGHLQKWYRVTEEASPTTLRDLNYWVHSTVAKLLPCVLLTVMTVLLIQELHLTRKRRATLIGSCTNNSSTALAATGRPLSTLSVPKRGSLASGNTATQRLLARSSTPTTAVASSRNSQSAASAARNQRESRTTLMLLLVVVLFLVTEMPQGILVLCGFIEMTVMQNVYSHLGDAIDLVTLLNESINFVLYTTMSKQFRDTFSQLFCRSKPCLWAREACRCCGHAGRGVGGGDEEMVERRGERQHGNNCTATTCVMETTLELRKPQEASLLLADNTNDSNIK